MSRVFLPGGWFISTKKDQGGLPVGVYIGLCTIGPNNPRYLSSRERACTGDRLAAAIESGDLDGPYDSREEAVEWMKGGRPSPVAPVAPAPAPMQPPADPALDVDDPLDGPPADDVPQADRVAKVIVPSLVEDDLLDLDAKEEPAAPPVAPSLEDDKTILDSGHLDDLPF